jgi:hypothetical protein
MVGESRLKFEIGDMVRYNTSSINEPRIGIIVAIGDNSYKSLHPFIYEVYWVLDQITSTYFYAELDKVS